jgi:hypothetical protein
VTALQILTVLSLDPVAILKPSWENATALTQSVCPHSVHRTSPVTAEDTLAVLSEEPLTTHLPHGEYATAQTS